jgi:sugar phosphate isomerase/epimerase
MYLGYNTNGLAHHELRDAVCLLADLGYRGVAVTIDHGVLSPRDRQWHHEASRLRWLLEQRGMLSVVETGARFLLDPREKHEPTLISPEPEGRRRRAEFYRHAIDCAAALGSRCVSLWSGRRRDAINDTDAWDWLVQGLNEVLDYAARREVPMAFEPEPGMLVGSMAGFEHLVDRLGRRELGLTLDIGHLQCQGELPMGPVITRWADRLLNVHLEDMRRGEHVHLPFGDGEIDFPPVIEALAKSGYGEGLYVELSRHSHEAPQAARRAIDFLRPLVEQYG